MNLPGKAVDESLEEDPSVWTPASMQKTPKLLASACASIWGLNQQLENLSLPNCANQKKKKGKGKEFLPRVVLNSVKPSLQAVSSRVTEKQARAGGGCFWVSQGARDGRCAPKRCGQGTPGTRSLHFGAVPLLTSLAVWEQRFIKCFTQIWYNKD